MNYEHANKIPWLAEVSRAYVVRGASEDERGEFIGGKGTIGLQAAVPNKPHTRPLRHEMASNSADTWNQTHLITTVKRNINSRGCKSFEHSDVCNLLSCKTTFLKITEAALLLQFMLGVGFCVFLYYPSFESDCVTYSCPDYAWF